MEIEVTKQMIDATFDFIEGRRTKKEGNGIVLRGIRGAKYKKCVIELLTRLIFCNKSLKMTILTKMVSRKEYA